MRSALRKTFVAITIALASLVIVVGIISLAMMEGGRRLLPGPSGTETASPAATAAGPSENAATPEPNQTGLPAGTATTESPVAVNVPKGWTPIVVKPNQTLDDIARQYNISVEALQNGNSLKDKTIQAGMVLFVPSAPAESTPTYQASAQCGPYAGWVYYYIQPGDTLYGIATMFGTTVNQLMVANCLQNTYIYAGQGLYVPNVAPIYLNPGGPLTYFTPTPTYISIPSLLTPQTPMLPTGIPFPPP